MRSGLSAIQQTLTPEASIILSGSIAEAGRRSHGQTTPLHVAATLLSSPSGFLRQACIRSHPNSSHPLQCRALDLCFSVALERLPTVQTSAPLAEPPLSNALMAALKRAQANQRRGSPEMQQQPLMAMKVELEHLVISILDDPSVSRVMREASFSSPAIKSTVEKSLISPPIPKPLPFPSLQPPSSYHHITISDPIPKFKIIQDKSKSTSSLPLWLLNAKPNQIQNPKPPTELEDDSYKKLVKILMEKVWWQREAVGEVARLVSKSKRRFNPWLILTGPDTTAKKKTASVVSNIVYRAEPVVVSLKLDESFRGKTSLDRIADEVRKNPFSMILIEHFDMEDAHLCLNIKLAIERGRIIDSYNREVSLGNVVFFLLSSTAEEEDDDCSRLMLRVCERSCKRRTVSSFGRFPKHRKTLDLNEAAEEGDDANSSDLTVDHECESPSRGELRDAVDGVVLFKRVDFARFVDELRGSMKSKFCDVFGSSGYWIDPDEVDMERILFGLRVGPSGLDEWIETVLNRSFLQLRRELPSFPENMTVRLEPDECGYGSPGEIRIVIDEVVGMCN